MVKQNVVYIIYTIALKIALYIHSALKMKKILTYATIWMNLEDIMLSDSHKKTNTVWFHLYEVLRIVKTQDTKSRMLVATGWGRDKMGGEVLLNKYRVSVLQKWKELWRWMVLIIAQHYDIMNVFKYHWTAHLRMIGTVNFMLCVFYHNKNKFFEIYFNRNQKRSDKRREREREA